MTHDELLAKIKEMNPYVAIGGDRWKQEQALRAVVELHKPSENYTGNICEYCFALAYEPSGLSMEYEDFAYPCPTIQAIEKELL
jgi:hypothetical protein